MIRKLLYVFLSMPFLFSCTGGDGDDGSFNVPDSLKSANAKPMMEVGKEVMEDLVQNVSSPIEMAALIKKSNVPFSKEYLSDPDLIDKYNLAHDKALNLGVLGADLGYLNIYDKTSLIISHITSIKSLAEDLRIGQFFEFGTLKRLASNNENLDSLMYISTSSFNKMDRYLRENSRGSESSLMVSGVWIEGLYLATQVAEKKIQLGDTLTEDAKRIFERIGEQKISLSDLLIVLKVYKGNPQIAELINDLEEVKDVFKPIKISVEMGEPTSKEINGMLVIIQNDVQHVEIPDGQMKKIIEVSKKIRNKIIKL